MCNVIINDMIDVSSISFLLSIKWSMYWVSIIMLHCFLFCKIHRHYISCAQIDAVFFESYSPCCYLIWFWYHWMIWHTLRLTDFFPCFIGTCALHDRHFTAPFSQEFLSKDWPRGKWQLGPSTGYGGACGCEKTSFRNVFFFFSGTVT